MAAQTLVVILAVAALTGCAGFTSNSQTSASGVSTYELNRTDGGCRVRIASGRTCGDGAIIITPECGLTANTQGCESGVILLDDAIEAAKPGYLK